MTFSAFSDVLWAVSVAGHLILLLILLRRKLRSARVLTGYMAFAPLESLALFLVYRYGNRHEYAVAYSLLGVFSYAFQLSIIYELARDVLRPLNRVLKAKTVVACVGLGALGLGMFAVLVSSHLDQRTVMDIWENRVAAFVSLSICSGIVGLFLIMNRFYLSFKRHALVIAQGLFIWHYSLLLEDLVHASVGHRFPRWVTATDYCVEVVYLAVLGYWIVALAKPEEKQEPMSEETRLGILNAYAAITRGESLDDVLREPRK